MKIPIWVTDPNGNNNPSLMIQPGFFVASEGAKEDGMNGVTANAKFFWSADGLSWNNGSFSPGGHLAFAPSLLYANNTWMCKLEDFNTNLGFYVLSVDGKNWTEVYTESSSLNGGNFTFNTATNQWKILLLGGVFAPQTVFISIPYGPNPNFTIDNTPGLVADPSQTAVTNPSNISSIPLPSGWTAMRYGFSGQNFQYTKTPITTTIINSGSGWPGATWVTTFTFDNAGSLDVGNNEIDYAITHV